MKKIAPVFIVLALMVSLGYCQGLFLPKLDKTSPLTLIIATDKRVYKAGENINAKVVIKNISNRELRFDYFPTEIDSIGRRSYFRFTVLKDASKSEQQYINIKLLKKIAVSFEQIHIKPGEEVIFKAILTSLTPSPSGWWKVV